MVVQTSWVGLFALGAGLLVALGSCGGNTSGAPATAAGSGTSAATAGSPTTGATGQVMAGSGGSSTGGTAPSCPVIDCDDPNSPSWHPGRLVVTPPDGACPYCDVVSACQGVACLYMADPLGVPLELPPELDCPVGYEVGVPPGACCFDCVRNQEPLPPLACDDGCPEPGNHCRPGYVPGPRGDQCCGVCQADQDYCNSNEDCVLAKLPPFCCSSVTAISARHFAEDLCYTDPDELRPTPEGCPTDNDCTLIDCAGPGPVPRGASCIAHHCQALP